jgi:hypothetical protein
MHSSLSKTAADQLEFWRALGRVRAQQELRRHPRRKVNIAAKIVVGESTSDCTLIDISDNGARIAFGGAQDLPDEFKVCMTPSGYPFRQCRLIWRSDTEMGVEFVSVQPWWV